jgi:branched-chain amino acid transport system ATP-binding protein
LNGGTLNTEPILETIHASKAFGGLLAVDDVSIKVKRQEIMGLIGPNGAGKTTLFNLITGFVHPTRGQIKFQGQDISHLTPHEIARKGIVRTFQLVTLFRSLTVLESIILGCHLQFGVSMRRVLFHLGHPKSEKKRAEELLEFAEMSHMQDKIPMDLPHGHQRILAMVMALAAKPTLLLLDEPMGGMTHEEIKKMSELILEVREQGTTVLLVEHNMQAAMSLCERMVVLNFGNKIAEGSPLEIKKNKEVIDAYLGTRFQSA